MVPLFPFHRFGAPLEVSNTGWVPVESRAQQRIRGPNVAYCGICNLEVRPRFRHNLIASSLPGETEGSRRSETDPTSRPSDAQGSSRQSFIGSARMASISTKSSLSAPQKRLLEVMQRLNFGRIEGLGVCRGEPVIEAAKLVVDVKLGGGENGPRPELAREDFTLKSQVVEMFEYFSRLSDGSVAVIHVQHGLPCRLTIEQPT